MQGSTSRFRNVYGEIHKEKFEDVKPSEVITEGSLIDVNDHFLAVRIIFKFFNINYYKILIKRFLGGPLEEDALQF